MMCADIREANIKSIWFLRYIANLLTLAPLQSSGCLLLLHKFFAMIFFIVIASCHCYGFYTQTLWKSYYKILRVYVLWLMNYIIEVICDFVLIIISVLCNANDFKILNKLFDDFENCYKEETNRKFKYTWFILELAISHLMFLILLGYDMVSSKITKTDVKYLPFTISGRVHKYLILITTLLIYNYCYSIKLKYGRLNITLTETVKNYLQQNGNKSIVNNAFKANASGRIQCIRKSYRDACELVNKINETFRWHTLILFVNVVTSLTLVICTGVIDKKSSFQILILIYGLLDLAMCATVVYTCDLTTKEAQRTAVICYKLLLRVPAIENCPEDEDVREELILLGRQATNQCPYFEAVFFKVDLKMLLALFGTVTSYIIMIIQLYK